MNSILAEQMSRNFQWILFDYVKGLTYPNENNVPSFQFSEKKTHTYTPTHRPNKQQKNLEFGLLLKRNMNFFLLITRMKLLCKYKQRNSL